MIAELGVTDTVIYTVAFSPLRDDIVSGFSIHSKDRPPPTSFTPPKLYPETAEKDPVYTRAHSALRSASANHADRERAPAKQRVGARSSRSRAVNI